MGESGGRVTEPTPEMSPCKYCGGMWYAKHQCLAVAEIERLREELEKAQSNNREAEAFWDAQAKAHDLVEENVTLRASLQEKELYIEKLEAALDKFNPQEVAEALREKERP